MTNENITLEGTAYLYDDSRIGGQVTNVYAYDNAVVESSVNVLENAFLYGTSTFAGSATTIVADANATVLGTAYATGNVVLKGSATFAGTVSGNVILDENATFTGSASGDIKIKDTATFTGQYGGTSAVYTPAIIFTGTADNVWSTIGNWTDLNGNAATDLPVVGASIIINANISGGGDTPLLNTVTVSSNADLGQTLEVLNGLTFLGSSRLVNTTVTGNAVFNDTSYNTGSIVGNATFNNDSYNEESVYGFATFNNSSYNKQGAGVNAAVFNTSSYNAGTVTDAAVFNNYSYNSNTGTVQGNAVLNDYYTYSAGTISGTTIDNRSVPYIAWPSGNIFVYTNLNVTDINNAIIYGSAQLNTDRTLNDLLANSTFGINSTNEQFTTNNSGYATYKSTASSIQEGGYVFRDKNTNIYYYEENAATALINAEFTINNISYATDNTGLGNSFKTWVTTLNDWPWTLTIYTNTNTNNLSGATAYSNKLLTTYPASGSQVIYNGDTFSVGANGLLTYVNFAAVKSWNTDIGTLYTASTTATNIDGLNVYSDVELQTIAGDFSYLTVPYRVNSSTAVAIGYNYNTATNASNNESIVLYSRAYNENGERTVGLDSSPLRETISLYTDTDLTSPISFNVIYNNLYYTQTNGVASIYSVLLATTNIGSAWIAYADMSDNIPDGHVVKGNAALTTYAGNFADITYNGTTYAFNANNETLYGYREFCGYYTAPFTTGIGGTWYIDKPRQSNLGGATGAQYSECNNNGIHYKIENGSISEWSKAWTGFTACNKETPTTVYTNVNVNALAIGVRLYTDIEKATIVNDGDFILNDDTHLATDTNGDVDAITTCPY